MITPPTPEIIPSVNKSVRTQFSKLLFARSDNYAKLPSTEPLVTAAKSEKD